MRLATSLGQILKAGALLGCCLIYSIVAIAQTQGQNAVFNSTTGIAGSSAFYDASTFAGSGSTVCSVIYTVLSLSTYPTTTGAVIDARGLNAVNTSMTCAGGTTPWNNGTATLTYPSTILLPPGVIIIPTTWVLPPNTRLIGEGDGISPSGSSTVTTPGTTIQAVTSFASGTSMIQFGSSSCGTCTAISVENLVLDGHGLSINGIVNQYAQDQSYVDHVGLFQILGTGLLITGSAENSGPYTHIVFDTGGSGGVSSTVCAQILSAGGTHGIHGLSCNSETHDAAAAVLLDSSGDSIEDVTIQGFFDGVLVGSNATALSNVLINIIGDTQAVPTQATPVNSVHISSNHTVHDLSIVGVSNSHLPGTYTIQDDTTVSPLHLSDQYVAIYALGKTPSAGVSRFTTSKDAPTWAVGPTSPTGACIRGSLYSCIGGGGSSSQCKNGGSTYYALWACALSGSSVVWVPIM